MCHMLAPVPAPDYGSAREGADQSFSEDEAVLGQGSNTAFEYLPGGCLVLAGQRGGGLPERLVLAGEWPARADRCWGERRRREMGRWKGKTGPGSDVRPGGLEHLDFLLWAVSRHCGAPSRDWTVV